MLPDLYKQLGVDRGNVISNIISKTTADRMNLQPNDVITEIDNNSTSNWTELLKSLEGLKIGKVIRVSFIRSGQRLEVEAPLGPKIGEGVYKFNSAGATDR